MKRERDDDPVARLLGRVETPAPLSDVQVERIAARLRAAGAPSPRRAPWIVAALGVAAIAVMLLARRPPRPIVAAPAPSPGPKTIAAREIALDQGRLVARGGDAELRVRVPQATVAVPIGAAVEVEVRGSWFQVAAYSGRPRVEWVDGHAPVELAAPEQLRCQEGACRPLAPEAPAPVEPPPVKASPPRPARSAAAATPVERAPALPPPLVEPAVDAPPPAPENAPTESALVEDALHALRRAHDPARALATTRHYRERFPSGALAAEADRIDVEALFALGRGADALALLERMTLDGSQSGRELTLARAELRAQNERCGAALADYDAVLALPTDSLAERALYGRAACHARLGERVSADRDLALYLARFPKGSRADEVRRALGRHNR